jgi:predicted nuclease of predicted toxin-antitoxin system
MRFKTDENISKSAADALRAAGHDVAEALSEGLGGAEDPELLSVCVTEARVFITLDKGLGDIRAYQPSQYPGIIVLRLRDQRVQSLVAL